MPGLCVLTDVVGHMIVALENHRDCVTSPVVNSLVLSFFAVGDIDRSLEFALLDYDCVLERASLEYEYKAAKTKAGYLIESNGLSAKFPKFNNRSY